MCSCPRTTCSWSRTTAISPDLAVSPEGVGPHLREIRAIPLGGDAAPEFRNEVTPSLDALLTETKGRIKVNIE